MSYRFTLFLLLLTLHLTGYATDTIPPPERARGYFSPAENFMQQAYRNPAINYYRRHFPFSELSLGWKTENANRPVILQQGKGAESFQFNALSYLPLTHNSKVWGGAHFYSGQKKEVAWNESSDFHVVFPYVMADTLGGDLSSEEYYFAGGYVQAREGWTWGVYADYRALTEYRKIDPRPRNTVSDLSANLGITLDMSNRYSLGLAGHVRKYKQTNTIKFFSELGTIKVFHLSGLGMDYSRFSGNNTSAYYKGKGYGGSLSFFPKDKQGLFVTGTFENFSFEKILSSLNEIPLNELRENSVQSELGYKRTFSGKVLGIKLQADYSKRKGTENLFGDATSNIYPQISSSEQYSHDRLSATLNLLYGQNRHTGFSWFVLPRIGINKFKTTYRDPYRMMEITNATSGIEISLSYAYKSSAFQFNMDGEYNQTKKSDLQLNDTESSEVTLLPVYTNYANLSGNNFALAPSFRWDYSIPKNMGIFISIDYRYARYVDSINQHSFQIACGFTF